MVKTIHTCMSADSIQIEYKLTVRYHTGVHAIQLLFVELLHPFFVRTAFTHGFLEQWIITVGNNMHVLGTQYSVEV